MNEHKIIKEYAQLLAKGEYSRGYTPGARGIVMCVGGEDLYLQALINIKHIREKSELPIEIYFADSRELSSQAIEYMKSRYAGLSFFNIETLVANSALTPEFMNRYRVENFRGFQIKNAAIYHSSFEEVLFIDCDIIPCIKCDDYFGLSFYKDNGYLIFPDFWSYDRNKKNLHSKEYLTASLLLTYYGVEPCDERSLEIESGLVVINKKTHSSAIAILYFINGHGKYFYKFFYGEKESYKIALHLTGSSVSFPMRSPVPFGVERAGVFYGDGMLQFLPEEDGRSYASHYHFTINTITILNKFSDQNFHLSIPATNEYSYKFIKDALGLIRMVEFGSFSRKEVPYIKEIVRKSRWVINDFKNKKILVEIA